MGLTSEWRKAGRSGAYGDNCVEARVRNGLVEVRNSKDPEGHVLRFTHGDWLVFIGGVKEDEFDL